MRRVAKLNKNKEFQRSNSFQTKENDLVAQSRIAQLREKVSAYKQTLRSSNVIELPDGSRTEAPTDPVELPIGHLDPIDEEPIILNSIENGDLDGDGEISDRDTGYLAQTLLGNMGSLPKDVYEKNMGKLQEGFFDLDNDGKTNAKDLRLLQKYSNGIRGDALNQETGQTIQNYIEDVIEAMGISPTQSGELNQKDIIILSNMILGRTEVGSRTQLDKAFNLGFFDVNNDDSTDMKDIELLLRYKNGARGDDLISGKNGQQIIDYVDFATSYMDIDSDGTTDPLADTHFMAMYEQGNRNPTDYAAARSSGSQLTGEEILERTQKAIESNLFDINGDGLVDEDDFGIISMVGLGSPPNVIEEIAGAG